MIYVKLKEFRAKHNKMKQSELGKLFGMRQTEVSRMESSYKLLTEEQYQILVDKFGEEDVIRFVAEPPFRNAIGQKRRIKEPNVTDEITTSENLLALVRVITDQQKTIIRLEEEIEKLKAK